MSHTAVKFKLGALDLVLSPRLEQADFDWMNSFRGRRSHTSADDVEVAEKLAELLLKCAREHSPNLTNHAVPRPQGRVDYSCRASGWTSQPGQWREWRRRYPCALQRRRRKRARCARSRSGPRSACRQNSQHSRPAAPRIQISGQVPILKSSHRGIAGRLSGAVLLSPAFSLRRQIGTFCHN